MRQDRGGDKHCSILVFGAQSTGKTSLISRYVYQVFQDEVDVMIGDDEHRRVVKFEDSIINVNIVDGFLPYPLDSDRGEWWKSYIRHLNGDVLMLLYSITDRASFDQLDEIYNKILDARFAGWNNNNNNNYDNACLWFPVVLVGTKSDLEKASTIGGGGGGDGPRREVSTQEAQEYAKNKAFAAFIETSAKNRINVDEAFHLVLRHRHFSIVAKEEKEQDDKKSKKKALPLLSWFKKSI